MGGFGGGAAGGDPGWGGCEWEALEGGPGYLGRTFGEEALGGEP